MAGYGRTARLYFYPRSPCGERLATSAAVASPKNFYPRSPCGERLASSYGHFRDLQISIHALLAESDHPCGRLYPVQLHISIHALLAESDLRIPSTKSTLPVFLSTLSLRRATSCRRCEYLHWWISIHALLAESDAGSVSGISSGIAISIHALLAESDALTASSACYRRGFLSTHSLRRATQKHDQYDNANSISIHPLLAERDGRPQCAGRQDGNFYPRSPCGERPWALACAALA